VVDQMHFIRVGMRRNGASVKLKLRWDNSPRTCELVSAALPIEGDMWHAKVDCVVVPDTALPTLHLVDEMERRCDCPVLTAETSIVVGDDHRGDRVDS